VEHGLTRDGGVVWALGLYASGSTWTFNVLQQLAAAMAPGLARPGLFVATGQDAARIGAAGGGLRIVKSHEVDTPAEAVLAGAARLIVTTIRDPLDIVASQMEYQHWALDRALDHLAAAAALCARHAADPRALLLRYEDGFTDDAATLDRLAARLGGTLAPAARDAIFAATRRPAVERYIAALPRRPGVLVNRATGDLLDPATHWHTHHANRTGEVGRWRRALDAAQVRAVEQRLGGWMAAFGYPTGRAG
jgi:hypothetical protein